MNVLAYRPQILAHLIICVHSRKCVYTLPAWPGSRHFRWIPKFLSTFLYQDQSCSLKYFFLITCTFILKRDRHYETDCMLSNMPSIRYLTHILCTMYIPLNPISIEFLPIFVAFLLISLNIEYLLWASLFYFIQFHI